MLILSDIEQLNSLFQTWIGKTIIDFKIVLLLNSRIEVHFLVYKRITVNELFTQYDELKGLENLITFYQIEFEEEEDKNFFQENKIDLGLRRRLTNLIEPNNQEVIKPCPVVTFYSYKGGTGRTTSLAFFASWLATNHGKKVVIIDCDFEAPGLTNYFDISEDRKGVLEYLLDVEYAKLKNETLDIIKDYSYKVRHEYVGKGDIFIVPAGNLSSEFVGNTSRTYRADYLEALARLDITSTHHIIQQFQDFFEDLKNQLELNYENSVILIDSRTGFNDTFATLATLSDIIVGFFGINKQSQVGLSQFLDSFGTIDNTTDKQILLVNSISEDSRHEKAFKKFVNEYVSANESKFTEENLGKRDFVNNIFSMPRTNFLNVLGTVLEDKEKVEINGEESYINNIFCKQALNPDGVFRDFFIGLYEKINFSSKAIDVEDDISKKKIEKLTEQENNIFKLNETFFDKIFQSVDKIKRRERLLKNLANKDNFPEAYADNAIPKLEDFFFRNCLKDIFNRDKFIIIGYKGTGKTLIYQAFQNPDITNVLCKRERQKAENFIFINLIQDRYFDATNKFSKQEVEKVGEDFFYERFWIAYVWNQIFSENLLNELNINLSSKLQDIDNDIASADWFRNAINDDNIMLGFENDLKNLDKKMKERNKTIILSFDKLDFVIKPENWSVGISPLLKYWRNNIFSRIYPKIFVRADIFENRLTNTTNINEFKEKSINIQWTKEELFAYFFKYVFKIGKEDFFALCYSFNNYNNDFKQKLLEIENSLDSEQQIPIEKIDLLRILVSNFFGKYANTFKENNMYGETYDWFFNNLTDAKGTISIRPFLELIKEAFDFSLQDKQLLYEADNDKINKVLSSYYYVNHKAKQKAAQSYYEDLAKDKGNESLSSFADFLIFRTTKVEDKQYDFSQTDFNNLLSRIMQKYPNDQKLENIKNIDDFRHILMSNGIIKMEGQGFKTRYVIPFLYRSYFGVGNPNKSKNTSHQDDTQKVQQGISKGLTILGKIELTQSSSSESRSRESRKKRLRNRKP